jgi:hypothetical protein
VEPQELLQPYKGKQPTQAATQALFLLTSCDSLPCIAFHPSADSCTLNSLALFKSVLYQILPVYLSLNFVPLVVLNWKKLFRNPIGMIKKSTWNASRSSLFFSTFVSSYMASAY